jgi:anti-sigma factor RsiW
VDPGQPVITRTGKTAVVRGEEHVTCEEVITFLLEYLSRELAPDEERNFERHLSLCPSCTAYLRSYRNAVRLGRIAMRSADDARPPELGTELVRAILQARG